MTEGILQVKLLHADAVPPIKHHDTDAGYDLASVENQVILPHGKALVSTGLAMAIPPGWYGRVAPRSSLGWKKHVDVGAGVIDSHYRGIVRVVLYNHSDFEFHVNVGDRIAQLIITRCMNASVEVVEELEETDRGSGGFGSTGT